MNRRLLVALVAVTLPPWFVALAPDGGGRETALPAAEAPIGSGPPERSPRGSSALYNVAGTSEPGRDPASAGVPAPVSLPRPSGSDDGSLRLVVSAPSFVDQGPTHELVVGLRVPRGARRIEFTLSADPERVELGDASRGKGSPRGEAAFEAYVDERANRITIQIEREDGWSHDDPVDMAIVRFEGVAAGDATFTVSEIAVRDASGATIPVAPAPATAQHVVKSGPI
jgi:hypothetical protein